MGVHGPSVWVLVSVWQVLQVDALLRALPAPTAAPWPGCLLCPPSSCRSCSLGTASAREGGMAATPGSAHVSPATLARAASCLEGHWCGKALSHCHPLPWCRACLPWRRLPHQVRSPFVSHFPTSFPSPAIVMRNGCDSHVMGVEGCPHM